jgi:glycerate 2-kinase
MNRILNAETLSDHGHIQGRRLMLELLEAGLRAADPYYAMQAAMHLEGDILTLGGSLYAAAGTPLPGPEVIDLRTVKRIFVFGGGKGITRAAKAMEELLGDRLTGGHLIEKHGTPHELQRIGVTYGAHPVPDEGCAAGCRRIIEMAADLRPDDLVITTMGNGVGSLLTLPVDEVSLEDVRRVVYAFQIEKGGPTGDLVPIRNHLDQIKGGKFTRYLRPARVVHMLAFARPAAYEDITRLGLVRWLHALPDETTHATAIESLKKWDLWEETPESVRRYLLHGKPPVANLSVAEFEASKQRVFFVFPPELGMVPTVKQKAEAMGFRTHVLFNNYTMKLEAQQAGRMVANMAFHSEMDGDPFTPPCVLLSGGEMIVTVGRETGMGGRNQEYIVAAAAELGLTRHVVMASVDSDGTDGPGHQFVQGEEYARIPVLTGGMVDYSTLQRAQERGIDLAAAVKRHDTSPALYALDDGIVTTPAMSMGDLSITLILGRSPDIKRPH